MWNFGVQLNSTAVEAPDAPKVARWCTFTAQTFRASRLPPSNPRGVESSTSRVLPRLFASPLDSHKVTCGLELCDMLVLGCARLSATAKFEVGHFLTNFREEANANLSSDALQGAALDKYLGLTGSRAISSFLSRIEAT